jgi:hypothetical protein
MPAPASGQNPGCRWEAALGSAKPEQHTLHCPSKPEIDVLRGARGQRRGLPPLDDGRDDMGHEARHPSKLAKPGTTAILARRKLDHQLRRIGEDQLAHRMAR